MPSSRKGSGEATVESLTLVTSRGRSILDLRKSLVRSMVSAGVAVNALAPDYDHDTREGVRGLGAEPVRYSLQRAGLSPLQDGADLLRLTALLRRLKPDATLMFFAKPVIYGSIGSWLAGVRRRYALVEGLGYVFAFEGRSGETLRRRALRYIVSLLYWFAFKTCTKVFFVNDEDPEYFVRRRLIDPTKIVRIRGAGVDLGSFQPVAPVTSPVTFLLMARLLREKGICEYVEAARMLKEKYPESRFLLLGGLDPNPGGLTREQVLAWVEEGAIEWLGHVSDVKPWIAKTSVYVLPSYYREGLPQSTQEAMAMARPVITTDSVGCRETVDEGVNGVLVPVRDPAALANAMEKFITEPQIIPVMGRASRRLAEERFDVRSITAQMLKVMNIA